MVYIVWCDHRGLIQLECVVSDACERGEEACDCQLLG
jgi:hypothetical protein